MVAADRLKDFVGGLSAQDVPITEAWSFPIWNHAGFFLLALVCLATEWGLRRTRGLA